jgi:SWIM zinc finger
MDTRQEKAQELASRGRVVRQADHWLVFSLTSTEKYRVTLDPVSCSCPDYELRQEPCKHVLAVRIDVAQNGSDTPCGKKPRQMTEEEPIKRQRPTYKQDWPSYDAAQKNEKDEFLPLLSDLCAGIVEPERKPGRGRRPASLVAQAFSACFKVFTGMSGRRFMSDLRDAQAKGFVSEAISYVCISRFLESEEATPILTAMLTQSSLPLKALEDEFAVDSSGFSASRFERWYNVKWGRMESKQWWTKAHIMCGHGEFSDRGGLRRYGLPCLPQKYDGMDRWHLRADVSPVLSEQGRLPPSLPSQKQRRIRLLSGQARLRR